MANRKINELSVRTPSLTDLMIVGDPSTGYSFKATLAALNTLIDSSTSIGDLNGVVITSPSNGQALVYDGTNWVNQSISVPVTSVFGRTGAVVATEGDYSLDLLSDVTLTTPSSNQVLQYNGTAWVNATLTDNGITSLNGLTALSQTFATGTSGTDFAITSTTSTHTFNLPTASAVNRGALSSADWSTFNAKQDAITLTTTGSSGSATLVGATLNIPTYTISGLGGISGSGTSGQVAYWTGSSSQSGSNNLFWDAANNRLGIGTTTPAVGLDVRNGANIYTSGAGANNHYLEFISTSNINGYVNFRRTGNQNGDYAYQLINNAASFKANSGTGEVSLFAASGGYFLNFYSNGTEAMRIFSSTRNVLIQNGGTFTDGGQRLQVTGDVLFKGSGNTGGTTALTVQNSDGTNLLRVRNDNTALFGGVAQFASFLANTTASSPLQIRANVASLTSLSVDFTSSITAASGAYNVLSIPQGFAPTSGTATLSNISITSTINQTGGANGITRGLYVNPTLTSAADWRSIEWSNNSGWGLYGAGTADNYLGGSLGLGNTSTASAGLRVFIAYSATKLWGVRSDGTMGGTLAELINFSSATRTAASATITSIRHFDATQISIGAGSTITNQFGFSVNSSMTSATNNYGFYGDIPSGTNRWNLYMNGTAANYMNGNLLLGSTTDAGYKLDVNGTSRFTGNLRFDANFRDNRDNTVISQSASGVVSNRDLAIGSASYGRMMFTSKSYSFTTGTHPSLGAYGFYYNGETNTGAGAGASIYFKAQTPTAANSNGGDFIIELPSGTGTGRQGSVIIGGTSPNASAIIQADSTTKGMLPPRMTNAQMVAIGTPAAGLMVYDTTNNKLNVYDGTNWVAVH